MNEMFMEYLKTFNLSEPYIAPFKDLMKQKLDESGKDIEESKTVLKKRLKEVQNKIDKIDERFALDEISQDIYDKFSPQYRKEKQEVIEEMEKAENNLSNLEKGVEKAINIASNLLKMWNLSNFEDRQRLQWLVFPEGIYYDKQKDTYRTKRINTVFSIIGCLPDNYEEIKKGTNDKNIELSHSVAGTGLEPVTFGL